MKFLLLATVILSLSSAALFARSSISSHLALAPFKAEVPAPMSASSPTALPPLSLDALPGTDAVGSTLDPSSAGFAQLSSRGPSLPLPSGLVLSLVALFVLALRIMGLNHARAMADNERDSYKGKARMFRSLHEGGTDH